MISETAVTGTNSRTVRVGPLLQDADGRLFAVVAARSLVVGQAVFAEASSRRLGVYMGTKQAPTTFAATPMTDLFGLVQIDPEAELSPSLPLFDKVAAIGEHLGRPVSKLANDGSPVAAGRLTAVLSTFALSSDNGGDRRYSGALEIESDDPAFAIAGDAGSAVVAEDGSLLGLLLAKAGAVAIAVAFTDLLAHFGLGLALSHSLEAHRAANGRRDLEEAQDAQDEHQGVNWFLRPLATFYGGQLVLDRKAKEIGHWLPNLAISGHSAAHLETESIYGYYPDWHAAAVTDGNRRGMRIPRPVLLDRVFDAAPRTPLKTLSDKLREEPAAVLDAPGLVGIPLNYVSGLEPALSELKLKRQEFALRLLRHRPRTDSASAAFDLFHQHFDRIRRSELKAIAYGRAVSMETVLICIVVVDGIAHSNGTKITWDQAYVEPAVFAMDDDRGELSEFLQHERGAMRAVEETFRQWSEMAPVFRGHPVAKLVDEAVKGHAMRFRTARVLDASVSQVFGRPLKWRAVHEGQRVVASSTEDRLSAHG